MKRLFKEPLIHFLLLGVGLFVLSGVLDEDSESLADDEIVVTPEKIAQLGSLFAKTWQRPPTADELKQLIDEHVLEEIYYREALAMGIDRDDTIIRRRLRQKMEFLTEDFAELAEPSEEDLAAYLEDNQDRFRTEPTYTFRQLYFQPDRHGDDPEAFVRTRADLLRAGEEVEGDSTLLPPGFENARRRAVDGTFGARFSGHLDAQDPGTWSDPIRSGLGYHLVYLEERTPGKLPGLEEIRNAVRREWENEYRVRLREQFNAKLLEKYDVRIEAGADKQEPGDEQRDG